MTYLNHNSQVLYEVERALDRGDYDFAHRVRASVLADGDSRLWAAIVLLMQIHAGAKAE